MLIIAEHLDQRRRSTEEITVLARDVVTRRALVTADEHVIECAFYMILALLQFDPDAIPKLGGLIGYHETAVPGIGMNGYPIFTSVSFLHVDDVPAFNAEITRMRTALGIPMKGD